MTIAFECSSSMTIGIITRILKRQKNHLSKNYTNIKIEVFELPVVFVIVVGAAEFVQIISTVLN